MAKDNIIHIPNVAEEARIGSSFNYMIKVITETDKTIGDVIWDCLLMWAIPQKTCRMPKTEAMVFPHPNACL